jgi:hypothetical protein
MSAKRPVRRRWRREPGRAVPAGRDHARDPCRARASRRRGHRRGRPAGRAGATASRRPGRGAPGRGRSSKARTGAEDHESQRRGVLEPAHDAGAGAAAPMSPVVPRPPNGLPSKMCRGLRGDRLYGGSTLSLQRFGHSCVAVLHQLAAPCHADIEVGDLLAQGIAVDAEQIGTFRLIAARRVERDLDERRLHLLQDALVEAGGGRTPPWRSK